MKRGLSSPYQIRSLLQFGPPVIHGPNVTLFSFAVLHTIPRDNPNGEKDEGYVLVNQPYKQTKSKLQVTIKISSSK